jgi:diacylglycerol kinase (ATP)
VECVPRGLIIMTPAFSSLPMVESIEAIDGVKVDQIGNSLTD